MEQNEIFSPSPAFSRTAAVSSMDQAEKMCAAALKDPDAFWSQRAKALDWASPWTQVCDWSNPPFAKWFVGGKLNASFNCLDRHLAGWRRNKAAIIWEGENYEQRTLTYQALHREVCRFANGLKSLGLKDGDRSIIYMPMVPEAAVAMLACARLGVIHSVVFGGFSAEALKTRIQDLEATLVITADSGLRRGKAIVLKENVD